MYNYFDPLTRLDEQIKIVLVDRSKNDFQATPYSTKVNDSVIDASEGLAKGSQSCSSNSDRARIQSISTAKSLAVVKPVDILCGRGKVSLNHAGNKRFRQLVLASLTSFDRVTCRNARARIVQSVLEAVHGYGGRFLKKDLETDQWQELGDKEAKGKIGHAFRDSLSQKRIRSDIQHTTNWRQNGPIMVSIPIVPTTLSSDWREPDSQNQILTQYASRHVDTIFDSLSSSVVSFDKDSSDDWFVETINEVLGPLSFDDGVKNGY